MTQTTILLPGNALSPVATAGLTDSEGQPLADSDGNSLLDSEGN